MQRTIRQTKDEILGLAGKRAQGLSMVADLPERSQGPPHQGFRKN